MYTNNVKAQSITCSALHGFTFGGSGLLDWIDGCVGRGYTPHCKLPGIQTERIKLITQTPSLEVTLRSMGLAQYGFPGQCQISSSITEPVTLAQVGAAGGMGLRGAGLVVLLTLGQVWGESGN